MHDVQLEERLRKALRAEADDLPFTISADLVAQRLATRRAAARRARFGLLATAAAVVVAVGAGLAWADRAVPPVAASQTPVPGQTEGASVAPPSQSTPPTGSIPYPEVQSAGRLVISIKGRPADDVDAFLVCEWISTERVGYFYLYDAVELLGEEVNVGIIPDATFDNMFEIGRTDHAAYHGGPTNSGAALTESSADLSSGTITFTNLTPDPESAPPGPLPTPSDGWTLPLGGEQANASISGTATWTCDPPPATVGTPAPPESFEPPSSHQPFPQLAVHGDGDVVQTGVPGCGASYEIDGVSGGDSCGPSYQVLGPDKIVTVKAGGTLSFTTTGGWTFATWSVGWATQAEAERFRGERPDTFEDKYRDEPAIRGTITVDAPPVGDWSVLMYWAVDRGADYFSQPDYFRVVVVP